MTRTFALQNTRAEAPLLFTLATLAAFLLFGKGWLADLSGPLWLLLMFGWLFAIILWAALKVVHHADCLAVKLGEPYGTLILTLSVISIEVFMISALMLGGSNNPTLARGTMFAVVMIVLNGMVGVTLLLGAAPLRAALQPPGRQRLPVRDRPAGDVEHAAAGPDGVHLRADPVPASVGLSDLHESRAIRHLPGYSNQSPPGILR